LKRVIKYLIAAVVALALGAAGFIGMAWVSLHGGDVAALHEVAHIYRIQRAQQAQQSAQAQQARPAEQPKQ
jgi:hypothetical protein